MPVQEPPLTSSQYFLASCALTDDFALNIVGPNPPFQVAKSSACANVALEYAITPRGETEWQALQHSPPVCGAAASPLDALPGLSLSPNRETNQSSALDQTFFRLNLSLAQSCLTQLLPCTAQTHRRGRGAGRTHPGGAERQGRSARDGHYERDRLPDDG